MGAWLGLGLGPGLVPSVWMARARVTTRARVRLRARVRARANTHATHVSNRRTSGGLRWLQKWRVFSEWPLPSPDLGLVCVEGGVLSWVWCTVARVTCIFMRGRAYYLICVPQGGVLERSQPVVCCRSVCLFSLLPPPLCRRSPVGGIPPIRPDTDTETRE